MTTTEPAVDLDGYTGDYAHDHALYRARGQAFFAPAGDEDPPDDAGRRIELALRDQRLFHVATWHHELAPVFRRARAAQRDAERALDRLDRHAEARADDAARIDAFAAARRAVSAYGCARSHLLVAVDRRRFPVGGERLYERYVAEDTRVRPGALLPEHVVRDRLAALSAP
ncbi:hypothetical protein [Streptomyces sp. SID3343]|uniref:hypothetical protein n=1 Tax=Streptomyces sp. SID3343 TaxID=2690260 RepID=UPI00136F02C1|nr:hypothetical protein [Streptomyces sp. SID3343]MYW02201.1 hypothetical protein [Streptomyces sp. SID3343]